MKKSQILEEIVSNMVIKEDYPPSFDKAVFYNLRSFAQRIKYCTEHLQKIAAGSGRVVFAIDEKTVLKLAKNPKGVAQNLQEAQLGKDYYFASIVTEVFNADQNDQWIESERAAKLKPTRFRELVGFDLETVGDYLRMREDENKPKRSGQIKQTYGLTPEIIEQLHVNDFVSDVVDLMHSFNILSGDLTRLSSYGEVNREGHPTIVLVDYGLSDEVYQDHYAPKEIVPRRY